MEENTIMGNQCPKTSMEDKPLNGKESLELISKMILTSKKNLEVGDGNSFLYWGLFYRRIIYCDIYTLNYYSQ
jgi:hypothetical protein